MRKLLLILLASFPLFATPPTVSNISFLYGSHSSVSVQFDISATANAFRVRYYPVSSGGCDQGNAAATVESFSTALVPSSLSGLQLPLTGLAANTQYEFCPEVSNDGGTTWSTTGGSNPAGSDFTTLPLPTIHPALPIHPATFDTRYPDTTQGTCWSTGQPGYCMQTVTVNGTSCTDLTADMNAAIAHQETSGTVIQIPAGSVCEYFGNTIYNGDSRSWTQLSPDAIAYNPSNIANNTITLDNHGLNEGQGVKFSEQEIVSGTYLPGVPSGLVWGAVYFVHVIDANDFQLYQNWQQETGSETSGSDNVVLDRLAGWASSPGISVGEEIVGSGIPSGTTISAIDYNAKTLTLSAAATATASGVTFTFGGPLQDIGPCTSFCSSNGGIAHFVPWPRQIHYWIIVRTSTPDSQFAPQGTRVNPSWASKMVTIEGPTAVANNALAPYVYSSHIRLVGIKWTWIPSTELSSDPAPDRNLISVGADADHIILDRDWFHGPDGRSNRIYEMLWFNGMDDAIVNSYWDNTTYWHASYGWPAKVNKSDQSIESSQYPSGTTGSTTFTVPQTTVYYGAANPGILSSDLTVSWTGTPNASITTPEIAVYFDMEDNLQIVAPQGLSVTASAGTVSYTTTSGSQNNAPAYTYCDEGDPMIPVDAQGHEAAAPLGCVQVNTSGTISGMSRGTVYHGSLDAEGCQCSILGQGPGPITIANNYISGSGIVMHFDNSGGLTWRGDDLIQRNTFHVPLTDLNDAANGYSQSAGIPSDGYWYANRQLFESKGGERYWLDGNQFLGGFADIDHGLPFLFFASTPGGYGDTDVDIANNTIAHDQEGVGVVGTLSGTDINPDTIVMQRYRAYNNLIWDMNGFVYSTVGAPVWGVGGIGEGSFASADAGPGEDFIFDHNTVYDLNGMTDQFWGGGGGPVEGVQITNNILPYGIGAGGEDLWLQAGAALNSSACSSSGNNEPGTKCSFIAGVGNPDLIFKGNLLIPTWQQSQYPEGGAQLAIGTIKADWPDYWAQNTIMTQNGALNALAAVGWQNHTITRSWDANGNWTGSTPNWRLLSSSIYNCCQTTDGLQEGANINQLEAAQGKVTLVGANQITSDSANVTYIAPDADSCSVDYSSADPTLINSFTRVQDDGGNRVRNVPLTGLSGHTAYSYRVNCAVQQPTGQFQTN